jgi:DNA-binding Lrp family transcriptional regulator
MDPCRANLLGIIQQGIPLQTDPWSILADRVALPREAVMLQLDQWHRDGLLRRIGGVFDATLLGYSQTLVAMAVEASAIESAAEQIVTHPGVSHCYQREDDRFNLWFTLAVSPDSSLGLDGTIDRLATLADANGVMNLPTQKRYKLHVRFGPKGALTPPAEPGPPSAAMRPVETNELQRRAICALQDDLPPIEDPFERLGRRVAMSREDLLVAGRDLLTLGVMRRYAAIVHHRRLGVNANALVVWRVGLDRADRCGYTAARHEAVSHCYLRPPGPDWPWRLYTMIHAEHRPAATAVIDQLAGQLDLRGEEDRRTLWTIREFKKQRVALFSDEQAAWEVAGRGD